MSRAGAWTGEPSADHWVCSGCGYPLAGLDRSSACPECGVTIEATLEAMRIARSALGRSGRAIAKALVFSVAMLLVALLLLVPSFALILPCACIVVVFLLLHLGGLVAAGFECGRIRDVGLSPRVPRIATYSAGVVVTSLGVLPALAGCLAAGVFPALTPNVVVTVALVYLLAHPLLVIGIAFTLGGVAREIGLERDGRGCRAVGWVVAVVASVVAACVVGQAIGAGVPSIGRAVRLGLLACSVLHAICLCVLGIEAIILSRDIAERWRGMPIRSGW